MNIFRQSGLNIRSTAKQSKQKVQDELYYEKISQRYSGLNYLIIRSLFSK